MPRGENHNLRVNGAMRSAAGNAGAAIRCAKADCTQDRAFTACGVLCQKMSRLLKSWERFVFQSLGLTRVVLDFLHIVCFVYFSFLPHL